MNFFHKILFLLEFILFFYFHFVLLVILFSKNRFFSEGEGAVLSLAM
tara:strand:+ start:14309 stop:14449 length:141 start_codon:yes stop_codon:yes gene_type:complete